MLPDREVTVVDVFVLPVVFDVLVVLVIVVPDPTFDVVERLVPVFPLLKIVRVAIVVSCEDNSKLNRYKSFGGRRQLKFVF
jgi:hypothetical protein